MSPEEFIKSIRKTFGEYADQSGGCYKFAKILVDLFDGDMYYDNNHCIVKIEDHFYDLRGKYTEDGSVSSIDNGRVVKTKVSSFLHVESEIGYAHMEKVFGS